MNAHDRHLQPVPPAPHGLGRLVMILRRVFIVVLVATGWWGGCATIGQEGDLPAQKALIGKTSQEVLACAGKPLKEGMEGDEKTVTYFRDSHANEESFSGSKSSVIGVRHWCSAELHFKGGRVVAVEYQPSARGGIEHCEEIFAQCL